MRVFRATNPEALEIIEEQGLLLPDNDMEPGVFKEAVKFYMTNTPDDVLLLVGASGDDITAYLLAHASPGYQHVFIYHAHSPPENPPNVMEALWEGLEAFAKEKGKNKVQMVSERRNGAWKKKWGFEEAAIVYERELDALVDEEEESLSDENTETQDSRHEAARSAEAGDGPVGGADAGAPDGLRDAVSTNGHVTGSPWRIEPHDPLRSRGGG